MAVLRKSGIKDSASDRMLMICIYVCLAIILVLVLYPHCCGWCRPRSVIRS